MPRSRAASERRCCRACRGCPDRPATWLDLVAMAGTSVRGEPGGGPGARPRYRSRRGAGARRLVPAGDAVDFRHELARLTVFEEVPAIRRRREHRRILEWLDSRGPTRRGWPTTPRRPGRTRPPASTRSSPPSARLRSAPIARRSSSTSARSATAPAYPAAEPAPSCTAGWPTSCTSPVGWPRRSRRRRRRWRSGPSSATPSEIGDAQRKMSRFSWFQGTTAPADGVRRPRLRDAGGHRRDGRGDGAPATAASSAMLAYDLDGTREWGRRALALVEGRDDAEAEEVRVHALNNLGTIEADSGDEEEGWRLLEESLRRSQAADLHEHAARAFTNLASQAILQHDHLRAGAQLSVGLRYCLDRDLDAWALYMRGQQALSQLDQGLTSEAVADVRSRCSATRARRGEPDHPADGARPGAGPQRRRTPRRGSRRGAGARLRHGRGPARRPCRRGGRRDRVDRRRTTTRHGAKQCEPGMCVQHVTSPWTRGSGGDLAARRRGHSSGGLTGAAVPRRGPAALGRGGGAVGRARQQVRRRAGPGAERHPGGPLRGRRTFRRPR